MQRTVFFSIASLTAASMAAGERIVGHRCAIESEGEKQPAFQE